MHLIEIDHVGAQPLQASFAGLDQMPARKAAIVRPLPGRETRLGGDQHSGLALAAHRFADNFLGDAGRVDVGGVDQIDAGVGDEIDEASHVVETDIADLGEITFAAEGHRPERHD